MAGGQSSIGNKTGGGPQLAVIVPSFNERDNIAPLYDKVAAALDGLAFEFIVVDDNSPDGTTGAVEALGEVHAHVRGVRRVGRRGLSSAVIEGVLVSKAPYFAVIDADHQHDERALPHMLALVRAGHDIAIGTRYAGEGAADGGFSRARAAGSRLATRMSSLLTGKALSDPMSGFFVMRRDLFNEIAPSLSNEGFKILLDIIVSAERLLRRRGAALRIGETPYVFRPRHAGESKMSSLVVVQFLGLVLSKLTSGVLPTTFLLFALVGGVGIFVHMGVLWLAISTLSFNFFWAQFAATLVAMVFNFALNNELTYANRKLRGWGYIAGLFSFCAVCSMGAIANFSVSNWIYAYDESFWVAGLAGVLMSVVFNYSMTRTFTWR